MRLTLLTTCLFGFFVFVCPKSIDRTGQVRFNLPHISIINGVPAKAGDFPFMASLLFPITSSDSDSRLCGGTLIASSYILTAAHCLLGLPTNTEKGFVFINTLNITGGGPGSITRRVSKYVAHQQFFGNAVFNDIALLVLDQPVPATAKIPFAQLPIDPYTTQTTTPKPTTKTTPKPTPKTTPKSTTKTTTKKTTTKKPTTVKSTTKTSKPSTKPVVTSTFKTIKTTTKKRAAHLRAFSTYSNESAIITGWGVTSSGSSSETLQKANVTVYDNTVCNEQWDNFFNGSTQVCAAQVNTSTCFGDSGGPLLVNGNVQIGVVSFGSANGCADPDRVPVFTRVSAYLGWIAATMASNPPPAPGK